MRPLLGYFAFNNEGAGPMWGGMASWDRAGRLPDGSHGQMSALLVRVSLRQRMAVACLLVMVGGCVSTAGLPEFRAYQDAFTQAEAASAAILDELAVAEREAARRLIRSGQEPVTTVPAVAAEAVGGAAVTSSPALSRTDRARIERDGFDDRFYVRDAVYQADLGDPPGTAAIRRSLDSVAAFNAVVLAYAEGRALDELKAQAGVLATDVSAALSAVALPLGVPGLALPGLLPALKLVQEGADAALQAASREAFREAVLARQPTIDAILVEVRDTAPTIFSLLTRGLSRAAKDLRDEDRAAEAEAAVVKIESYRRLLANWVILLDQTRSALAATIVAIKGPRDQTAALADVARSTAGLRERTARINALLVELRRGGPSG